jgi:hypothetical protein
MSLNFSIKDEIRKNIKLTTDIEYFRDRYVDSNNKFTVTLPGFDIRTFDKTLFVILSKCSKEIFEARWIMRPDYVSYEFLNSTIYWPLIMYINNCYLIEEFKDFDSILVPNMDIILELARLRDVDKRLLPLEEPFREDIRATKYFKNYPFSSDEIEKIQAEKNLNGLLNNTTLSPSTVERDFSRQLTSINISNKYLDLDEDPDSPQTGLVVYYNNFSIPLKYNFDYVIIPDDNDRLRRISWNIVDILNSRTNNQPVIPTNSGIRKYIKENDILKIKYSVTEFI